MARMLFCTVHRIAYNTALEYNCPQCTLAHQSSPQLDFDGEKQLPKDKDGKLLDPATLTPKALYDPDTGQRVA